MKAIERYKKGNVSLGLGARIAKVSISEFLDILKEYNVEKPIQIRLPMLDDGIWTWFYRHLRPIKNANG